jgi:hypothetical protein
VLDGLAAGVRSRTLAGVLFAPTGTGLMTGSLADGLCGFGQQAGADSPPLGGEVEPALIGQRGLSYRVAMTRYCLNRLKQRSTTLRRR